MVKELAAGIAPRLGVDLGKALVQPWIEQFSHGPHIGDGHMADLGRGDGLDELRGEQRIALDAFVDHETAGNQAQPYGHREDDRQTDERIPTQQVERPLGWRMVVRGFVNRG
ncbi:hypothetical protein D9M71_468770 [compost metagenome]